VQDTPRLAGGRFIKTPNLYPKRCSTHNGIGVFRIVRNGLTHVISVFKAFVPETSGAKRCISESTCRQTQASDRLGEEDKARFPGNIVRIITLVPIHTGSASLHKFQQTVSFGRTKINNSESVVHKFP
jgi:hypothetical protein